MSFPVGIDTHGEEEEGTKKLPHMFTPPTSSLKTHTYTNTSDPLRHTCMWGGQIKKTLISVSKYVSVCAKNKIKIWKSTDEDSYLDF